MGHFAGLDVSVKETSICIYLINQDKVFGTHSYGILDGTTSEASSRADDFDFAYVFNRRVTTQEQDGFTDAIDAFLSNA